MKLDMAEKYAQKIISKLKTAWRFLLVLLVILFIFSLWRNLIKIRQAKQKVKEAERQVEELKKETDELARKLEIIKSEEYKEKEIRDKLGLSKEGERIIVLPDEEILRKLAPRFEEEPETLPDPNWKKWARLFGL